MWKKTSAASEMRVRVDDLSLGMYVSRLTSPQGNVSEGAVEILISSSEDIDRLRARSGYVYIDVDKSDKYSFLRLPEDIDSSRLFFGSRGTERRSTELAAYQKWIACASRWFSGSVENGFICGEN